MIRSFKQFATKLSSFFSEEIDLPMAERMIRAAINGRQQAFLHLLKAGVFSQPDSVYHQLFQRADIDLERTTSLVEAHGVEGALERFHDAGVYLTLEEFKGRTAIERGGWVWPPPEDKFENPLLEVGFPAASSGSSGLARRALIDFDLLAHEAAYTSVFVDSFGIADREFALYRPSPPGSAGIKNLLCHARRGREARVWFSQKPLVARPDQVRHALFLAATLATARIKGHRLPWPRYVPLKDVHRIASWLAACKQDEVQVLMDTNVASAVRLCLAAQARSLDIAGTFFRVGGEPLTERKREIVEQSGCRLAIHYSMSEVGRIGTACADRRAPDDVHLALDKFGLVLRPHELRNGEHVEAMYLTTLHPHMTKLMINVETGDQAQIERRVCSCGFGRLGFNLHLSGIHSYEKLTTEGMHFLGRDIFELIEVHLPERFGGAPTDFQFVEVEEGALTSLRLRVHPRLGELDADDLRDFVLARLGADSTAAGMMADHLRAAGSLRIERAVPESNASGKILPLQTLRARQQEE